MNKYLQKEPFAAKGVYKDGVVITEQPYSIKGMADVLVVFLERPRSLHNRKGNAAAVWDALSQGAGKWKDESGKAYIKKLRAESEKRCARLKW